MAWLQDLWIQVLNLLSKEAVKQAFRSYALGAITGGGIKGWILKKVVAGALQAGFDLLADAKEKAQDDKTLDKYEGIKGTAGAERDQIEKDILTGK